ncbi:MAG TPA: hypothetical protein PKD64_17585 [Pirellulaceae bacterium]|nr:hypothetical protein [Pirellulaceae bacterium]HMO94001.1 hypothetical protein [Pirellulaceae bacterium]HMP70873.1 hypothetical protein [Pirellulaceae bacterium]
MSKAKKELPSLALRLAIIIFSLIYLFSLEYIYLEIISRKYLYMGLRSSNIANSDYLFAVVMVILTSAFMPPTMRRPSTAILIFMYGTVVLPTMIFPCHLLGTQPYQLVLSIAGCFILLCLICGRKPIVLPAMDFGPSMALTLLVLIGFITLALRFYFFPDIELDFNLYDVYHRRLQGREITGTRNINAYALNLGTSGVGLLLIAVGITKRIYALFFLGVFIYFVAYLTVGNKDSIFVPILLIFAVIFLKYQRRVFVPSIFVALILLIWLGIVEWHYRKTFEIASLLVRRQLVFPSVGNLSYFQFFSVNPLYYWSDSFLRFFIDCPYPEGKAFLMGRMAGSTTLSANTNIWASAFADAGYLGMILVTVVVGYIARILDGFATRLGLPIVALVAFGIAAKMSNTGLERVMFTHGALPVIVFLYLLQPLDRHSLFFVKPRSSTSYPHLQPKRTPGNPNVQR